MNSAKYFLLFFLLHGMQTSRKPLISEYMLEMGLVSHYMHKRMSVFKIALNFVLICVLKEKGKSQFSVEW